MLTICQHTKHGKNFNLAEKHSFMKARFATECTSCGDQIQRGKEIAKIESGKWVHKHCAPETPEMP